MGQVVVGRRLRDQVYDLIRQDLKRGLYNSEQRLYEVDLAAKYGVSRTPVREALFQLVREGLIISEERGFSLPVYDAQKLTDNIEVHLLLDPKVAASAAANRTPDQLKIMSKAYERSVKAHGTNNCKAYVDAVQAFRIAIREMCDNEPLRRCSLLIEDQFLPARNEFLELTKHREMDLANNKKIMAAIESGDSATAEKVTRDYILSVRDEVLGQSLGLKTPNRKETE